MADLSYSEIAEGIGTTTGDTLVDIANVAGDFFCDVYSKFPAAIVGSSLDNPGARFADGLARRICAPRNQLPDQPAPVPPGGQCPEVLYNIIIRTRNTPSDPWSDSSIYQRVGPVRGVFLERASDTAMAVVLKTNGPLGVNAPTDETVAFVSGDTSQLGGAELVSVVRDDGLPDNCGNGFPNYPDDIPPPNLLAKPLPVPVGGPLVEVPVEIVGTKYEIGISIKPEFNINVGGIQVKFDITGAKITIAPTLKLPDVLPPGKDTRPSPPAPVEPGKEPVADPDLKRELDEIKDKLDELEECACDEDPEGPLLSDIIANSSGGVYSLPANTEYVEVQLTVLPSNSRVEFGNGTSQNVIYAGWYSFGTVQGAGDRLPISYEQNVFFAPKGASRFSFTVRKGAIAVCTAYYRDEPEEET